MKGLKGSAHFLKFCDAPVCKARKVFALWSFALIKNLSASFSKEIENPGLLCLSFKIINFLAAARSERGKAGLLWDFKILIRSFFILFCGICAAV